MAKQSLIGIQLPIFFTILIAFCSQLVLSQSGIRLETVLTRPAVEKSDHLQSENYRKPEQVTIIAPRTLRPNSNYHILLSLSNSSVPATFDLQLIGGRDTSKEHEEAKSVLVDSEETQVVKFNIGSWPPAEYMLSVNVTAVDRSWNFSSEHSVYYTDKTYSILIQTDKAIYKPGQLVQFRALFFSSELKPLLLKEQIHVRIYDSKRNMIRQWTEQTSTRGLLSLQLPLSEDPVLGDWLIKVGTKDQEVSKSFTVAEYILPSFDVQMNLPSYATNNNSQVLASVRATYTYGKPVRGQVLLTVQPLIRFRYIDARPMNQAQMKAPLVDGVAEFTVDLLKDLKREPEYYGREFEFHALVEEDLTGRKYNRSAQLTIYDTDVKIDMLEPDRPYKPGLNYTTTLKIAYRDDIPVEDNGPELELEYIMNGKKVDSVKLRPVGGLVEHTWLVPRPEFDNSTQFESSSLEIQTNYRGYTFVEYLRQFLSSSNQYMTITMLEPEDLPHERDHRSINRKLRRDRRRRGRMSRRDKTVAIGERVSIRLDATEPMQKVTCYGMAGRDIIWAFNQHSTLNKTSKEFDFAISSKMAPSSSVMCFYVRKENKEMIADFLTFSVTGAMKNPVKVVLSESEAKPGQSVDVEVLTKPYSTVGLLAVDQSVLLLKSGNDITEKDVENEMKSYGSSFDGYSYRSTVSSLFENTEVLVMSNNLMFMDPIRPVNSPAWVNYALASGALMESMTAKMAFQTSAIQENFQPPQPVEASSHIIEAPNTQTQKRVHVEHKSERHFPESLPQASIVSLVSFVYGLDYL